MLGAVLAFVGMDASMKLLAAHYPPLQVGALRGLSSLPLVLVWAVATRGWASLRPVNWRLHLIRAALGIAMMASFVFGLSRLPLSSAYAITFVAPMLVTAMAVPLLGEKVGLRRWMAVIIGLAGVLVILRPGAGTMSWPALAVLGGAFCYAASAISVRILTRTDSTQAMVVWVLLLMGLGAGALAWPQWLAIRPQDIAVIAMVGVFGALGQVALTEAFRVGEASQVAPLEYTALVWTVLIDVAVWGVLPDAATWLGAAIIVMGGFYLLRRERVHDVGEHP
ncbi:DMT family transporter [Lysobacter pythonis]|uniref:DMT family transporter n=2 Tax=Solilutibacter pythonis TaxID=2483112 RepID=A0A3M2I3V0_9GAMM|nr:DMT family transporter [Lysobacter pythonis]